MRVTEVLVGEYGGAETLWQRLPSTTGLPVLARVRGEEDGLPAVGGAAITLGQTARSPWNSPTTAEAVRQGTERLLQRDFRLQDIAGDLISTPLSEIPDSLNRVESGAILAVCGALEGALLDLAARLSNRSIAGLLGAVRSRPRPTTQTVAASSSHLRERLEDAVARFPVIRLRTSRDPVTDLEALRLAARTGRGSALWLECDGGYSPRDAFSLARSVNELLASGVLTGPVYLEQPMGWERTEPQIELIQEMQAVSGGLHVLLGESVRTAEDLTPFLESDALPGVVIDARDGVRNAMQVAVRMKERAPSALMALVNSGSTDLEQAVTRELARALPRLDLYLPGHISVQLSGQEDAGRGHGLQLSAQELASTLGRRFLTRSSPGRNERRYKALGTEVFGKNTLDSYLLEVEARRLGLRTTRFRNVDFHAEGESGAALGFHCSTGPATTRYGIQVAEDKHVTKSLLEAAGVPVPRGASFRPDQRGPAVDYASHLGFPVVIKPLAGKGGAQVQTDLRSAEEVRQALEVVYDAGHPAALVEEHVLGRDYRFLVVGEEVVSVVERTGAKVIGDGASTVAELVVIENSHRQENPHLRSRPILLGDEAQRLLAAQGFHPDSVPCVGQEVRLSSAANLGLGGHGTEVLDETHPSLCDLAKRAARAIPGLEHVGVDVLAPDHAMPGGAICEVNAFPGLGAHHFPTYGPSRRVAADIMEHYAIGRGLSLSPLREEVAVEMLISGLVQGVGYLGWFRKLAEGLGLTGTVRNAQHSGMVCAHVQGDVDLVTALAVQAHLGPRQARVELVRTAVTDPQGQRTFEVLE